MNSFFKNVSGQLFDLFIQRVVTQAVLVYSFFVPPKCKMPNTV